MLRHRLRIMGIGFLVFAGLGIAAWLALGEADQPPTHQRKSAKSPRITSSDQPQQLARQGNQDQREKADNQVQTEIVRRLLKALDDLPNVNPEEKRELRRILLDSDNQLAQALKSPQSPQVNRKQPAEPQKPPQDGSKMPPTEGPRSPLIKALLDLLDNTPEDNIAERNSQEKDTLRENLLQADKILAQHTGQSAVNRIKAANRKPVVPRVFNPPRKTPGQPPQQDSETEKTPR